METRENTGILMAEYPRIVKGECHAHGSGPSTFGQIESTARRRITKQTEANREHREEEVANHSILMQSQTQKVRESNSIFDQAHGIVALPSSSLTHKMLEVQRKAAIGVVEEFCKKICLALQWQLSCNAWIMKFGNKLNLTMCYHVLKSIKKESGNQT
ncbi:hypothetical protein KEM48_011841 [Puccinia striiformis f. sp. tritici PST-130]|nr:hypothetical protein KEM48_011841 [Puccinia striiformis f. sp. tritici PST-130]